MGETIHYRRPDGQDVPAYLAMPREGAGAPGVVVVSEWWGLGSPKERSPHLADRLAEEGFRALVPDLFRGKHTTDPGEASRQMNGLDMATAVDQDLRGAVQHLKTYPGGKARAGIVGFCMGGALAIAAAVRVPELEVAVAFYGLPPAELADPSRIRVNFQGHFARRDDWVTPARVDELERKLKAGGVVYELYRYEAGHAFMNDVRPEAYDAQSARQAWDRAVPFLRRALGTAATP
jgi:carboxymethylenebutenolidase